MIQLIDDALAAHLRAGVPLPTGTDLSFDTPDRTWGASITRPTVNLFLWSVQRDESSSPRTISRRATPDGVVDAFHDPVVSLRYLVTAWAGEHRDEHQLLGSVLRCLLAHEVVDTAHRPAGLAGYGSLGIQLATSGDQRASEFWSSLDGQLKPSLEAEVLVRVPIGAGRPAGPPVDELVTSVHRWDAPDPGPDAGRAASATAGAQPTAPEDARLRRTRRGTSSVLSRPSDPELPER